MLVDYFVELQNVPQQLNTLEIKRMFHEALRVAPPAVVPLRSSTTTTTKRPNEDGSEASAEGSDGEPMLDVADDADANDGNSRNETVVRDSETSGGRPNMLLGKFVLDPVSTDFIG